VPRGTDVNLALDLNPMVQHGHVIEISGKTDPTARVMVNSQEVPSSGMTHVPLFHHSAAEWREPHHHHGAECKGWSLTQTKK